MTKLASSLPKSAVAAAIFPDSKEGIEAWARRYEMDASAADMKKENELLQLRDRVRKAGYLTRSQLQRVAQWKSPRIAGQVGKNSEEFVNEVTRFALSAQDPRSRIESLTVLDGVMWPMASVILHFFHADPYPILDFRAIESMGREVPNQYNAEFWLNYVNDCRELANRHGVDMRTLDRALWQFSKSKAGNWPKAATAAAH